MATIVIDPGHYDRYNPGVCYGYYEGNTMLVLAQYLGSILSRMGANVVYTRTTNDQNPSLAERGGRVPNADMFISLHSDAADNASARGVTSFYSVQRPETEPFAAEIGRAVANVMGNQFRGTVARPSTNNPSLDYYGVLRAAAAAGVRNPFLIEHGFHTNIYDCVFLSNEANLLRIAEAEAAVIARHFNLSSECLVYYTVQSNDTLSLIGQKFGISWPDIATANNIESPYTIAVGRRLAIPLTSGNTVGCTTAYIVQAGDTLSTIARNFNVNWQDIASLNNITAPYTINIGQRLAIPASMEECQFTYTVRPGDSLYGIARTYGVDWNDIASINNIATPENIIVGQCLIIPLPRA